VSQSALIILVQGKKKLTERLTDQLKAEHKFREKKFHSAEELPLSD